MVIVETTTPLRDIVMAETCSISSDDDLLTLTNDLPTNPGLEVTGLTEVTVEVDREHLTVREAVTGYLTSLGDAVSSTWLPVGKERTHFS